MRKLDSKLQKQRQGWSKISNAARKNTTRNDQKKIYDSEVQMYARACSGPRLANWNHLKSRTQTKTRTKVRGVSSEFVKFKTVLFSPMGWPLSALHQLGIWGRPPCSECWGCWMKLRQKCYSLSSKRHTWMCMDCHELWCTSQLDDQDRGDEIVCWGDGIGTGLAMDMVLPLYICCIAL